MERGETKKKLELWVWEVKTLYHRLWSYQGASAQTPKQRVFIWRHTMFLSPSIHHPWCTCTNSDSTHAHGTADWKYHTQLGYSWIALTKCAMHTSITQAKLCREQQNRQMRMYSVYHASIHLHPSERVYTIHWDIYLNLLMWLDPYLWPCVCAHTRLLCMWPLPLLFVYLWSCWNETRTFCLWAEFTETGLVLTCSAEFRIGIYVLDDHSSLHRCLVIRVFASLSPDSNFVNKFLYVALTKNAFLQKC